MFFKKKEPEKPKEPQEERIVYEIKSHAIPKPEEDELVIFTLPPGTPKEIAHKLEELLAEAVNLDRRYLMTSLDLKIRVVKKNGKVTVEVEDESNNRASDTQPKA